MNAAGRWVLGVGLAVAAWAVISATPDHREHTADPIPVPAALGESVDVSGMTVTVTDIRVTDGLEPPGGTALGGRWVVLEVSVLSRDSDLNNPLGGATMQLNDTLVTASDLIPSEDRLDRAAPRTGLVVSGSILFQVPPDAPLGEATILLSRREASESGVWADDQAQLDVDLGGIAIQQDLAFDAPTVAAP
ncbi:hypothetical protein [Microbacterium gorillae]|uniref:hypothetical protein n=1 Tax=Microbacterium gorillae TaxID=1231063 RepID=UPI003D96D399